MAYGNHRGGYSLSVGEAVASFDDHWVRLDRGPEELVREFAINVDYDPFDADLDVLLPDAREYVMDTIEHVNAVASERGVSWEEVNEQRVNAQLDSTDMLEISNVWEGAYDGRRTGLCLERAVTLHGLHRELGLDSKIHIGGFERSDGSSIDMHAWTSVNDELYSDPSASGEGTVGIEQAERYLDGELYSR